MNKLFITIILSLTCLLISSPVAARLTLGVVAGADEAAGEIISDQVSALASLLAEKLQEEVVVKVLPDSSTLVDWLDRFAVLDLALLSAEDVRVNRDRFLLIGKFDEQGKLNLVARQGVAGDLPQRAARIVRESGFAPWRSSETTVAPVKPIVEESPPFAESESVSIDEVPVAPEVPVTPAVEPIGVAPVPAPEEPVVVAVPVLPQEGGVPKPLAPLKVEQPEIKIVATDVVPSEPEPSVDIPIDSDIESRAIAGKESSEDEQQKIIEEVLIVADVVPAQDLTEESPFFIDEKIETLPEDEVVALLGENTVVAMVAQPDIPQELRPMGIPVVRPGRLPRRSTAEEDELLVASMPAPLKNTAPVRPPTFLPKLEPEPGVVYIVPFVAVMVPTEVQARIFDLFVDLLNQEGEALGLRFVILKSRLQDVAPEWLASRNYVTGKIYAYVEETGSSWTELRGKTRVTYRRSNQDSPAFEFEYPVKSFFDNDHSTLDVERSKLADKVAMTLADKLLKALQN